MRRVFRILRRTILILLLVGAILLLGFFFLRWRGLILYSHESNPDQWEVFGVDVSSYQGTVDWHVLASQGVDFAFIKATEGSLLQDKQFASNWKGSLEAGVRPGA